MYVENLKLADDESCYKTALGTGYYQQLQLPSANMADADLDTNYIRCPCNYEAPIPGVRGLYTSD